MRKRAILPVFLILSFVGVVFAQKTYRPIHFGRGRTSAVIKGTVLRGQAHDYTLSARAGQTMSVHISGSSRDLSFKIIPPNANGSLTAEDGVRDWQGELPETGEYYISVNGPNKKATYTLEVTIR